MDRSFHEAPLFWVLFTGLIVLGAVVGMVMPHGAVVQVLLVVQVVNGVLLGSCKGKGGSMHIAWSLMRV